MLFIHGPISKKFEFMQDNQPVTVEQLGMKRLFLHVLKFQLTNAQ